MEVAYNKQALEDRQFWINSGNKKIQNKISALIEDIKLHPYEGLGKPEALKYALSGKWSRKIDKGNRLIYAVEDEMIRVFSMKGHYE